MPQRAHREDEERPQKRRRRDKPSDIVEQMETTMDEINGLVPREYFMTSLLSGIPRELLESGTSEAKVRRDLKEFKFHCRSRIPGISAELESLTADVRGKKPSNLLASLRGFDKPVSLTDDLQEALLSKPSPSEYAKASVWKEVQTYPRPILCLRPTDKHGLPLTLLHSIFSQFHLLSRQPLPNSPAAASAMRAALRLCSLMGEAFEKKDDRSRAFDAAVGGFLHGVDGAPQFHGRKVGDEMGRAYRVGQRYMLLREEKVEIGTGGDAYTQVARSYDLACEEMEKNGVLPDTPAFLLCVMGPTLTIAGGFRDGDDTVVEPLCPILIMLKDWDNANGRAVQLATHLFALRACMEQLPLLPRIISGPRHASRLSIVPGLRGHRTQANVSAKDQLLFHAVDDISRQLCVKIVYGPYGDEVHRMLGREKMAPDLLGVSRIEGGPTMFVMEMLDKPWQTLYTFAQWNPRWTADGVKSAIHKRLEEILTKLEGQGLVHGDFRANNIMVKPGEEESAVVIDFDWAGKDGEVRYPLYRNDEGVQWPGEAGSAIRLTHDRSMLGTEWASLLKP